MLAQSFFSIPAACCRVQVATNASETRRNPPAREGDKKNKMAKMMVPMSTGQVDPYISEQVTGMQIRSTPAEFPLVLLSTSSISILSSIVAMSMASTRRPPRPRSPLASPPLHLRTAKTTQLPTRGDKRAVQSHSGRIERPAAWQGWDTGVRGRRPGDVEGT